MFNIKFALRTLFKAPLVTTVAILSLALGIGANVAIFSLFNQLLIRPLPVVAPGRLVNLSAPSPKPGSTNCNQSGTCEEVFSYPMFRDLEREQKVFAGFAGHRIFSANVSVHGQTLNGDAVFVSGGYFPTLGLQAASGRLIGPDDDRAIGSAPVAVLSHSFWQSQLASDPAVVGQPLVINGHALTVIGVAPRGFEGTTLGVQPYAFVPITMRDVVLSVPAANSAYPLRRNYWVYTFARLNPGVTIDQARAALNVPYHAILNDVEAPLQTDTSEQTMARFRARQVEIESGAHGQSRSTAGTRAPLTLLVGVTVFVLLIACANIANLLLARSAARSGEMAIRLAIGAGRWRIIAQLLTEACLLAFFGGAAGLVVARLTFVGIASLLPAQSVRGLTLGLDGTAIAFAAALTLGTGLLFGLYPAIHSTRPDLATALKNQSGQPSGGRAAARFRTTLATAQIAISMALLVSAGLFVRSLANISRVDLGLQIERVATFGVSPGLSGYPPQRALDYFARLEDALAALPGVTTVTSAQIPLLNDSNSNNILNVQGFDAGPDTDVTSRYNGIGPDYFATFGVPILAGREFTRADAGASAKVAVVNEAFAKKFNLGASAVGKRIGNRTSPTAPLDIVIVGLVRNAKYATVKEDAPPQYFVPYRSLSSVGTLTFYVRSALDPDALLGSIRGAVTRLDAGVPIQNLRTMDEQVRNNVFLDRFITILSSSFAILATLLAAVGLYGVLAYTVTLRTREIGLRMALGADAATVRGMMLRQVGRMLAVGGVAGLLAALAIGRASESLLFKLKGSDPVVLAAAAAALTLVALAAGIIPAQRASRVDPMRVLRYE